MTQQNAVNALDKTLAALKLRKDGKTYPEIAQELDYHSPQAAFNAVKRALKRTLQEPSDAIRKLEVERLDALFAPQYEKALSGDRLAAETCLKIAERRARILGLDAPEKQEVTSKVVVEIEREENQGASEDAASEAASD